MNQSGNQKSIWVWALIAFALLAGLLSLLTAARYLGWLPTNDPLYDVDFRWLGALLAFLGLAIWLGVAYLLYRLDNRARLFVAVIAGMNIVSFLLALTRGDTIGSVLWGGLANLAALVISLLPDTKKAFGAGKARAAK